MERTIAVKVNGEKIGEILTNRGLSEKEVMWALGYDITDEDDLKKGYEDGVKGFYLDDNGNYCFDEEALTYNAE